METREIMEMSENEKEEFEKLIAKKELDNLVKFMNKLLTEAYYLGVKKRK